MTETSPNPPTSPTTSTPALTPTVNAPDDDALAHLYKMSRTAGLGSGDYVAINPVSVAAIIFGLAGALVVVDPLFLSVPIVGLVLSVIAVRQVRNSNGTQTGGAMAVAALLLSLGFLGYKVVGESIVGWQRREDRQQITALIDGLGADLNTLDAQHLASAYARFDDRFMQRVPRERFDGTWVACRNSPFYGPLKSLHSNGQLKFDPDPRTGDMLGTGIVIPSFEHGDPPRWSMFFRKMEGKWQIEDMPDLFPAAQPQQPGRR